MSNRLVDWLIVLLVILGLACCVQVCQADTSHLRFSWDAVTINSDKTPCTDLAGYALYRSREAQNWTLAIGSGPAFLQVSADITYVSLICPESGEWYWIVRAFDKNGNYSGISDVVLTNIDTISPNKVFHFRTCQKGDINCDGDVNSSDLKAFSEVFGQ